MKSEQSIATGGTNLSAAEVLDADVRFLLANERTLLAWVRTGLALVGGGLLLAQLGVHSTLHAGLGVVTVLLGALMSFIGYVRYRAADRAIRASRLPDMGWGTTIQVIVVIGFAVVIAGLQVMRM